MQPATFSVPIVASPRISGEVGYPDNAIQYKPKDVEKYDTPAMTFPNPPANGLTKGLFLFVTGLLLAITLATLILAGVVYSKVDGGSATAAADADPNAGWGYKKLGADWMGTCAEGKKQSPIDFSTVSAKTSAEAGFTPITMSSFKDVSGSDAMPMLLKDKAYVGYSGYGVKVEKMDAYFEYNNDVYTLLQYHFHTGSEHTVNGDRYPGECHFVHQNAKGEYLVVGVMMKEEATTAAAWAPLFATMPSTKEAGKSKFTFDYTEALTAIGISSSPAKYYTYTGSFTTPPCTEGVTFVILDPSAHLMSVSGTDIAKMVEIHGGDNYRVAMPLNGRTVHQITA